LAPAVGAEAVAAPDLAPVAALVAVLPAALLPVAALVVLLLLVLARLLREAHLLRPLLLPEVAALLVWVQGLVASESLRSR
jgi:hypothetical protein